MIIYSCCRLIINWFIRNDDSNIDLLLNKKNLSEVGIFEKQIDQFNIAKVKKIHQKMIVVAAIDIRQQRTTMGGSKRRNNIISRLYVLKADGQSIFSLCNVINIMKGGVVTNTHFLSLHEIVIYLYC